MPSICKVKLCSANFPALQRAECPTQTTRPISSTWVDATSFRFKLGRLLIAFVKLEPLKPILRQVCGPGGATGAEAGLSDRLQSDMECVTSWSLWGDVKIVLSTMRVLAHLRAY